MMMHRRDGSSGRGGFGYDVRPGYWFAPKRFGIGSVPATPIGWVASMLFLAVFGLVMWQSPNDTLRIAIGAPMIIAYLALVVAKTDGGWRWRWGGDR